MGLAPASIEYRVPKREISAEAAFWGHPGKVIRLFLNERAPTREGAERPSDLLNGPGEFLPAIEPPGKLVLLRKDALMVLAVPVEEEFPSEMPEKIAGLGTEIAADIVLQDGAEISGIVAFLLPEAKSRLIDFLNLPERFFAVRQGSRALLVNKRCIVRISLAEGQE